MEKKFWKNKKVLITGYEGFVGSHLTKTLLGCKAKVWGIDTKVCRKKTILLEKELDKITMIRGSVENYSLMSEIIKEGKIEYIFHLAAKALVGDCLERPTNAFSTNIKGTWNVLETARNNNKIKAIVIASSDKAYGSHKELPYKESAALQGNHPYDVSKSCADLIAYTYFHTYDLPVCVTRCGNIYGPGDFNFSRIIPDTIKTAIKDKTLTIRSDGKSIRDYNYVEDIVEGYILIAEKMQSMNLPGEAFNLSNKKPISVLELVKKIYKLCNKKPDYKILNMAKYEIKNQCLSSGKAKKLLGWKTKYSLEKGLRKTIEWYNEYYRRYSSS